MSALSSKVTIKKHSKSQIRKIFQLKDYTGELQEVTASTSSQFNGKLFKIIEADTALSAGPTRPKSIIPEHMRVAGIHSSLGNVKM